MYNPLQFFKPVNARFDLAGQMATQISEQNRLRDDRAKQQAGEQRFLGLQQLGQYQPDELQNPQVQGQMEQAKMDMLGGGDKYLNYQLLQQREEARKQAEQKMSDPRIIALRESQDESFLKGQDLLSQAIKTTDPVKRDEYMMQYKDILAENLKADRQLTAFGLPSHAKRPLPSWTKGLGGMAKQLGAEDLASAELAIKQSEKAIKDQQVKNLGMEEALKSEALKQSKERTIDAKAGSQYQINNAGFVKRMIDADRILSKIQPTAMQQAKAKFGSVTGLFDDAFSVNSSEFITPNLRDESGAAIGKDEFESAESRFIPKPADTPQTLAFKARNRANIINKGIQASGKVWKGGGYSSPYTGKVSSKIEDVSVEEKPKAKVKRRVYNPSTGKFE